MSIIKRKVGCCDNCGKEASLTHTVEGKWLCIPCLIEMYKRRQEEQNKE